MTLNFDVSEAGKNFIKNMKVYALHPTKDGAGVWTIGYGHTDGVTPNMTITEAQADQFF